MRTLHSYDGRFDDRLTAVSGTQFVSATDLLATWWTVDGAGPAVACPGPARSGRRCQPRDARHCPS